MAISSSKNARSQPWLAVSLFFALLRPAVADIDAKRPFLADLDEKSEVQETDFDYPFVLAETAKVFPKSYSAMTTALVASLKQEALPFRGHFSKSGIEASKIDEKHVTLPEVVRTGGQLEGIQKCNEDKCLMKLTDSEKKEMEKAKDKVAKFRGLIAARLRLYLLEHELKGYEDRKSDTAFVPKMLALLPFAKVSYPTSFEFANSGFWKAKSPPSTFKQAFFRQELVNIAHDKLQPIWRIGEILEFKEKDASVFFEFFPYSNHYLDSSLRIYEVMPHGKKSVVAITDVMEIDELTKSGVIRLLYKGKMQDAVAHVQHEELADLEGGGN